jgi:MATE family multidrug resistance protein
MILSNISVPLLGMVDTGVTGHLDNPVYLGAVAIGATIFGFLYAGMNFLRMGTTGITAQRFGAEDYDGVRVALGQSLIVALGIAAVLLMLQAPLGSVATTLIGPEVEVAEFTRQYFFIRIWSAPATLVNYALVGWFVGLQDTRIPLVIVLAINLTNIVLDLLFVIGLGMTVDGVAAASVIAEYTGMLVGLSFVISQLRRYPGVWVRSKLTRISEYAAYFSINANLFFRTMALMFTFAFITAQGARMGGLVLAANAILMNLQTLMSYALDGFAHAAEALVGKAVGSGRRDAVEQAVRLALRWSLYVSVAFMLAYAVGGPLIIDALTDLPEVREAAHTYLPWLIVSPIVSVWSFLYDGVFVGATRAREMRDIMVASALLVFVPAWYMLQFLGNHGLWLAFTLFMASRGIGMHIYYHRNVLPTIQARLIQ